MKFKIFAWATFIQLTAISPVLQAIGNSSGGGGVGFLCKTPEGQQVYLADTYSLHVAGLFDRYVGVLDFAKAVEIIDQKLPEKIYPHPFIRGQLVTFGFMISHTYNGLHFEEHGLEPKSADDDNITPDQIPAGCKKIPLAWQNLKTGMVNIRNAEPYLKNVDWFYLQLHESLIALRNRPGLDTTPIRSHVQKLASILSNPANFALEVLQEMARPYQDRPIVPKDQQSRFRTLYYLPQELTCTRTWTGNRSSFRTVNFKHPKSFAFKRLSGDGRVGQENVYQISPSYPGKTGVLKTSWPVVATNFYTESYNAFGDADGVGTFSFSGDFKPASDVDFSFRIHKYDSVTNEYIGEYDVNDAHQMHVAELDSSYGLRCWTTEIPIFRHDERSSIYPN